MGRNTLTAFDLVAVQGAFLNLGEMSYLSPDFRQNCAEKHSIDGYVSIFHAIFRGSWAKEGISYNQSEQLLTLHRIPVALVKVVNDYGVINLLFIFHLNNFILHHPTRGMNSHCII